MRRSRPEGKSLLEAVVMISLLSIILGLSATSLASLFRLRYTITRDTEHARSIDRLAMRLRQDAHEAVSASVAEGCDLTLGEGKSIRYSFATPRIVREVREGQEGEEKIVHRDSFSVPRHSLATFHSEPLESGTLIRVVIEPENTRLPPRELPRSARIEAAVGIHGTLTKSGRQP
jgi:type II secretory pathway component PulJ